VVPVTSLTHRNTHHRWSLPKILNRVILTVRRSPSVLQSPLVEANDVALTKFFPDFAPNASAGKQCLDGSNGLDCTKATKQVGAPSSGSRRMHQTSGRAKDRQARQGSTGQEVYGRTAGIKKGFEEVARLQPDRRLLQSGNADIGTAGLLHCTRAERLVPTITGVYRRTALATG
jgi:hypothetical protein